MKFRVTCLIVAVVLCISCNGEKFAEGRQMFRELLALRDEVAKEFHEKVVDVNLMNGDRMTIKFIDSPLNAATRDDKQRRADEVAAFVATHYKRPIKSVSVQFVSKAGVGVSVARSETFVGRLAPSR